MGQGHTFVEEKRKHGVWAQVSISKDVPCGVSLETEGICALTKLTMSAPNLIAHLLLLLVPRNVEWHHCAYSLTQAEQQSVSHNFLCYPHISY